MARKYNLKNWDRKRIIKPGSTSQTLAASQKILLSMDKKQRIVKAEQAIHIPQGIIRYEVIAAYGPTTVTIT